MAATTIPTSKQSINAVLSTTADNYRKAGKVKDAWSNSNPVFHCLNGKEDGIREETSGGDMYTQNVSYSGNSTFMWYDGYEQLNIAPQDGITTAYFKRAQASEAVSIDGLTRLKNRSKPQIQNLLREKVKQTVSQFGESMDAAMLDIANIDVTNGQMTGGKAIHSLPLIIQADPDGAGTYAAINQATQTWWNNKSAQSTTDATTTYVQLLGEMRELYALCSLGGGGDPDILIGTMWDYLNYMKALDEKVRYTQTKKGDVGFAHVMFNNAKFFWDGYMPDVNAGTNGTPGTKPTNGAIYMLNSNAMHLRVESGLDFASQGFRSPVDQDASTSLYLWAGQLVVSDRRKHGVLYDTNPDVTGA